MSVPGQTISSPRHYSPFWPMLLLLVAVLIDMGWKWRELHRQHNLIYAEIVRLEPEADAARNTNKGLEIIFTDIKILASSDEEARAIVEKAFGR